jgi:hypothetical protein
VVRSRFLKFVSFCLGVIVIIGLNYVIRPISENDYVNTGFLSQPIAKETILVTSAGQSTETYILQDIVNGLRLSHLFMPQAYSSDLEGIASVVISVGYSEIGERLLKQSFTQEKQRFNTLIDKAKDLNIPIITVYLGGSGRRNTHTDALLKYAIEHSSYVIATEEGNLDGYISRLTDDFNCPLALVKHIKDISDSLASAYR